MERLRAAQQLLRRASTTALARTPREHVLINSGGSGSNAAAARTRPTVPRTWAAAAPCARCIGTSATLAAKNGSKNGGGGGNKKTAPARQADTTGDEDAAAGRRRADAENPFDMADVEEGYARAAARGEDKLKTLRLGGRFNADAIGRVPVALGKKAGGQTVALSEAALVDVRQGRLVQLTLFEPAHRKAVVSAIQASGQFNQQPQPDPDDPAILTLKIEAERLEDQLRAAKDVAHAWREALRKVTSARQKKHVQWKAAKVVGQDDKVKLDKMLQKLQDASMKAVDAAEEKAVQALRKARSNSLDL